MFKGIVQEEIQYLVEQTKAEFNQYEKIHQEIVSIEKDIENIGCNESDEKVKSALRVSNQMVFRKDGKAFEIEAPTPNPVTKIKNNIGVKDAVGDDVKEISEGNSRLRDAHSQSSEFTIIDPAPFKEEWDTLPGESSFDQVMIYN